MLAALLTAPGEGWRFVFGIFSLCFMSLSAVSALLILFFKRKFEPVNTFGWRLAAVSCSSTFLMLEVPIRDIIGDDFPCAAYLCMAFVFVPTFACPLLGSGHRLNSQIELQTSKTRVAAGRDTADQARLLQDFQAAVAASSELHVFRYVLLGFIPPACMVVIMGLIQSQWFSDDDGCELTSLSLILLAMLAAVLFPCSLYIFLKLWNKREAFGIRKLYAFCWVHSFFFTIVYFLLKAAIEDHEKEWFNIGYAMCAPPVILCITVVIVPFLRHQFYPVSSHISRRPSVHGERFDFKEFIGSPLGYHYMLNHLMREFSPEHILFYKAVEDYKASGATFEQAQTIFHKYIVSGAPLEVNTSYDLKDFVSASLYRHDGQEPTPEQLMTMFDHVQLDIVRLMEKDSLVRFRNSELWDDYWARREDQRYAQMSVDDLHHRLPLEPGDHRLSRIYSHSKELIENSEKQMIPVSRVSSRSMSSLAHSRDGSGAAALTSSSSFSFVSVPAGPAAAAAVTVAEHRQARVASNVELTYEMHDVQEHDMHARGSDACAPSSGT